jgi:hypothetical protein
VLAGVGAARAAKAGAAIGERFARAIRTRPARSIGAAVALGLVALAAAPLVAARVERLGHEAREVGRRMELQRDLARAVDAAGGPEAIRELGSATSNRALHTRLAWELGRPIQDVERGYGHRVVFRTGRKRLAGEVLVWGTPRRRLRVARAGTVEVYRRTGLSYRLFTSSLQGIHILAPGGRNTLDRVVTR